MSIPITAAAGASDAAQPKKKKKKSVGQIFYPKKTDTDKDGK